MKSKFCALVRHGDYHQLPNVPSAYQPFPLNGDGFEQAQKGCNLLKEIIIELGLTLDKTIECSSLLRAWQTADVFLQNIDELEDIKSYDDLGERSVGAVANLPVEEIEEILRIDPRYDPAPIGWKSDSHYRLPFIGAESLLDAGERVAERLTHSIKMTREDHLKVVVAHGASIRHAAHILGALEFDEIAKLSMYHAHPVIFEIKDDQTWTHIAGDWKIRTPKDKNLD